VKSIPIKTKISALTRKTTESALKAAYEIYVVFYFCTLNSILGSWNKNLADEDMQVFGKRLLNDDKRALWL